ncbi:type II toxin-antitoxin system PemK/MazF family toxin [Meiothermus taiwanensis]|jgi:mRNA interferase MazF|uniref:Endoribonuclease MazF3 n=2 Tax=Meiothermus taiwanensis TaxID=172827 RepID=A0A399E239_9DEIN|nr:type II toxin-antitoxin system PemK/MazF family toxin [Meiothermus taiwanensis]AWR87763.1 transcriptional modulator of MazE/toxin, MazF [Meiothermus taiwanensis WR-220]KIQ54709.1 MazF family transcriptional regulator [Meiothermus taiwanensis]KZK15191.1 MazF family transcriptional regulator [Meiothermus taiwanensis]RIH77858.1 Endoribonuclease MazF3 [Meiothermus taiwanensis]
MKRGELYRIENRNTDDPKRRRVYVLVSRQSLIDSPHSTVVCAPVFSSYHGIATQVPVGVEEGLKHQSSIHCDDLTRIEKSRLTQYVGRLSPQKMAELDRALAIALDLPEPEEYEI